MFTALKAGLLIDFHVAKALVGIGLYVAAVGIPLTAALVWLAIPGSVAQPFPSGSAFRLTVELFAGTAAYFAGILVGVRRSRWVGTRLLPLGVPVILGFTLPEFVSAWAVFGFVAFVVVIAGVAAWTAFVGRDRPSAQSRLGRGAMGLVVAAGTFVVFAASAGFLLEVVGDLPSPRVEFSSVEVDKAGRIVRVTRDEDFRLIAPITDLEGNLLPDYGTDLEVDWVGDRGRTLPIGSSDPPTVPYDKGPTGTRRRSAQRSSWMPQDCRS